MRQWTRLSRVQFMTYCWLDPWEQLLVKLNVVCKIAATMHSMFYNYLILGDVTLILQLIRCDWIFVCFILRLPRWQWNNIKACRGNHCSDVIMGAGVSNHQPYDCLLNRVYSGADQRKHQSSASLAFARGIHRWPVNSSHKWPLARKMFPFDDVIMTHISYIYFPIKYKMTKPKQSTTHPSRDYPVYGLNL